jgi:antitoxin component HigA of HigAB toxin-antitoxin module
MLPEEKTKHNAYHNAYIKKRRQNDPEFRKKLNSSVRKYLRNHPEVNARNTKKFRQENLELCRKYDAVKHYCKYHGMSSPHLRNEFWNGSKVRVSRMSNGQFISWKEVARMSSHTIGVRRTLYKIPIYSGRFMISRINGE